MFGSRERIQKWFCDIVEKFRQKGALSPDKAMTTGRTGINNMSEARAIRSTTGRPEIFPQEGE
jgi:hypothetical protein